MEQTARQRLRFGIAAGLALCAVSAPSHAQFASSPGADKSEAILGAPSALAAIMAAQVSGAPITALAASLPLTYAVARPAPYFQQAPFALPEQPALDAPVTSADEPGPAAVTASPTRPDVFNSVAMPVGRTPLDARWSRVGSASVGGAAAAFASDLRARDERARIEAVNAYVNARVAFVDDIRQFGQTDRWSAASETLGRGRGDCEDYALAKMAMLRRAGFADRNLYFVVLKDLVRRADHAVLVVRSEGRFLVLDNGTDRLMDSAEVRDYRPVMTFSAGQRFIHGYRRSASPPMIMASSQGVAREPGTLTIATSAGMPSSPFASR